MSKKSLMTHDPVVEEVRAIRAKLWKEAGNSVEGLVQLLDQYFPELRRPRSPKHRKTKAVR